MVIISKFRNHLKLICRESSEYSYVYISKEKLKNHYKFNFDWDILYNFITKLSII